MPASWPSARVEVSGTDADEAEVLGEPGSAPRQVQVEDQLPLRDAIDDRAVVRTGARGLVATPQLPAIGVDPPAPALAIPALRAILGRHGVLVRPVGPVARRDHDLSA